MIQGKSVIKGGSIFVKELNETYSKQELLDMPNTTLKDLLSFMDKKELDRVSNFDYRLENIVCNIFDRL